jgi:hypothetical protein
MDLQELAVELKRQNETKRDFIVEGCSIFNDADDAETYRINGQGYSEAFSATKLFHEQVASTLDIPVKYYKRMLSDYPELLTENVNGWFRRSSKRYMVRTLDGHARALLSDRYRRVDNMDVAEAVLSVLGEIPDVEIESCDITADKMYLKVVNPRLEAEVKPGDIVQAGICISNSEVGMGAVKATPLIYRLVCTNGMVVNAFGHRSFHIGTQIGSEWELYSDETRALDDQVLMAKILDVVKSVVDRAKFSRIVDTLREAAEVPIEGDIIDVVELASKEFGITHTEKSSVISHLVAGGDLSKYGLANAVTRTSQDAADYDRATEMESMGWSIATMPKRAWDRINGN